MPAKPRSVWERLKARISVDANGCWIFTGAKRNGYGVVGLGSRTEGIEYTHRIAYAWLWNQIPAGQHIDHLCRVRACCNPYHLEAVSQKTNNQRAHRAKKEALS
jgi:hypothetical protein